MSMSIPKKIMAAFVAISFCNVACFNSYTISTTELEKLQTGFEAEEVEVLTEGCSGSAALEGDTRIAQADDAIATPAPAGCEAVSVSLSNTISVVTTDGASYRVTPFNFTLGRTQLVAPDYDLLLPRSALAGAEVQEFSTGKTIGLIAGVTAAAVGSFLLISVLAPADRGLGGS